MPWNGAGTFNREYSWVADAAAGIDISSTRMDADTDDITGNGLGNCLTRDGQGQPNADIPFNGFRVTGAGDAIGDDDYVTLSQARSIFIGTAVTVTAPGPIAIATTDQNIFVNQIVPAPITLNLPSSPGTNQETTVFDDAGSAGSYQITVSGNGNTINGAAAFVLAFNYQSATFRWNGAGTGWRIK